MCQNGGTLNGVNCTCDCADGFSGANCASEYICCEGVSSIKCSTQLHVIVILKCALSSVYMAYAPWHETPGRETIIGQSKPGCTADHMLYALFWIVY